jgi:hypothetical protein
MSSSAPGTLFSWPRTGTGAIRPSLNMLTLRVQVSASAEQQ